MILQLQLVLHFPAIHFFFWPFNNFPLSEQDKILALFNHGVQGSPWLSLESHPWALPFSHLTPMPCTHPLCLLYPPFPPSPLPFLQAVLYFCVFIHAAFCLDTIRAFRHGLVQETFSQLLSLWWWLIFFHWNFVLKSLFLLL